MTVSKIQEALHTEPPAYQNICNNGLACCVELACQTKVADYKFQSSDTAHGEGISILTAVHLLFAGLLARTGAAPARRWSRVSKRPSASALRCRYGDHFGSLPFTIAPHDDAFAFLVLLGRAAAMSDAGRHG